MLYFSIWNVGLATVQIKKKTLNQFQGSFSVSGMFETYFV